MQSAMVAMEIDRPRLGLALSGGGARGLAHIGVLKVLEREGIRVNCLAGTSMGGVIAAPYAAGMSPGELEAEALTATQLLHLLSLADPGLLDCGLIRGQRLLAYFERQVGQMSFDQLRLPLALVTVDLNTGEEVVLQRGRVADALRATIAIPGLFAPVESEGRRLVDGGVLNNLPVDVVRRMGGEIVIGVDVGPHSGDGFSHWLGHRRWLPLGVRGTLSALNDTAMVMTTSMAQYKVRESYPDVLIRPQVPPGVSAVAGYRRVRELIAAGESATEEALPEIEALLYLAA